MDDPTKANRDLNFLYPDIRVRYFRLCEDMKTHYKPIFLTDGYRSFARQKYIHDNLKTIQSAEPGKSWHNYGLAFDVAFLDKNPFAETHPWADLRRMALAHGLEAISTFNKKGELTGDKPHLQLRYGLSLSDVRDLYTTNGLVAVWSQCDKIRGVDPGVEWSAALLKELK